MSIHLSQQADSNTLKKDICSVLEVDPKDMKSKLNEIVEDKFEKTSQFLAERDSLPSIKICDLKDDEIESGNVPLCRMCSPSDIPTSTSFIASSQYGDITFQ
jgi:hypothetical protein